MSKGKKLSNLVIDNMHILAAIIYGVWIVCSFFSVADYNALPVSDNGAENSSEWYYRYYSDGQGWLSLDMQSYLDETTPQKGTIYHLTTFLPERIDPNYAIAFQTKNCWVTVFIDEKKHYSNIPSQHTVNAEYLGVTTHIVPIPVTATGESIDISLIPCTNKDVSLIDSIYSGDSTQLISRMIANYLLPLIVSMILIFLGIQSFFTALPNRKNRNGQMYLFYGLFCALHGIFTICHFEIFQLFFKHTVFFYELKLATFALLAFPALRYIATATEVLPTVRHRILQALPLLNFIFVITTHLTGLLPMTHTKAASLGTVLYSIALSLYYTLRYILHNRSRGWRFNRTYIIFTVYLGSAIIETLIFYLNREHLYPLLSIYALLLHMIFIIRSKNKETRKYAEIGRNAEHLQDAAYYDSLTQLMNRTALNRDMEALENNLSANSSIAIIQLDLNYLKRTNDMLGHIAGDRLLTNAASAIHAAFSDYGKCYRFGGDEFVIILIDNPKEKYNLGIAAMENECEKMNRSLPPLEHVSIAYGIAYYAADTDTSLWRVQERADEAMYERKRIMKQKKAGTKYEDDRL